MVSVMSKSSEDSIMQFVERNALQTRIRSRTIWWVSWRNRGFEGEAKADLVRQILEVKMQKCVMFDKCGKFFQGIERPEYCGDRYVAEMNCDFLANLKRDG